MRKIALEEHYATARMIHDMKIWEKRLEMPGIIGENFVQTKLPKLTLPVEEHRLPEMDCWEIGIQVLSGMDIGVSCVERSNLTEEQKRAIYYENAERILHLN